MHTVDSRGLYLMYLLDQTNSTQNDFLDSVAKYQNPSRYNFVMSFRLFTSFHNPYFHIFHLF